MPGLQAKVAPLLRLPVHAWAIWREGEEAVHTGGRIHPASPLPPALRRRVSPIGRRVLEAAWAVLAGRNDAQPRIILSSRHGEYARTLDLLRSLAITGEVSPADFSLAVHHGLAGLLSIVTGNRAGHQAIAAGADTLGAALQEAAACLSEDEGAEDAGNILLLFFDEALPEVMAPVGGKKEPALAMALLLGGGGGGIGLSWRPAMGPEGPGPAQALAAMLTGADEGAEVEAAGLRMIWTLCHAA